MEKDPILVKESSTIAEKGEHAGHNKIKKRGSVIRRKREGFSLGGFISRTHMLLQGGTGTGRDGRSCAIDGSFRVLEQWSGTRKEGRKGGRVVSSGVLRYLKANLDGVGH